MPSPDIHTILSKIERYLLQRQAFAGNTLYTEPLPLSHPTSELPMPSSHTHTHMLHTDSSSTNKCPQTSASPNEEHGTLSMFAELESSTTVSSSSSTIDVLAHDPSVHPEWAQSESLSVLYHRIHTCLRCRLGATRTQFVFGTGNPHAELLIIGEAPGADEDAQGEPFVGRAGQLLNKILEAIHFQREDVYIANIIKCRPPNNRRPEADEVACCEPYLYKQIDLIQPKLILALGLTAVNTLLKTKYTMAAVRGRVLEFRGIPVIATYHPAALLRNPEWKRATWEDVKKLRALYDSMVKR